MCRPGDKCTRSFKEFQVEIVVLDFFERLLCFLFFFCDFCLNSNGKSWTNDCLKQREEEGIIHFLWSDKMFYMLFTQGINPIHRCHSISSHSFHFGVSPKASNRKTGIQHNFNSYCCYQTLTISMNSFIN